MNIIASWLLPKKSALVRIELRLPRLLHEDLIKEALATQTPINTLINRKLIDAAENTYFDQQNKRIAPRRLSYEMLRLFGVLTLSSLFLTACASTGFGSRQVLDLTGATITGLLASQFTKSPIIIAGSAALGYFIVDTLQGPVKITVAQYNAIYDRAQSDAVKDLYWAKERLKRPSSDEQETAVSNVEIPIEDDPNSPIKHVPRSRVLQVID